MHKLKFSSSFIHKIINLSLMYLFFFNIELFNNRNLKAKEINLNLNSCHWIPIKIKKKSQKKIRYCLANNCGLNQHYLLYNDDYICNDTGLMRELINKNILYWG